MKTRIFAIAALAANLSLVQIASADGFNCEATDENLRVAVYNHVQPEDGTRTAAVMVISDRSVGRGNQTVARFSNLKNTLKSHGATYTATVDLRLNDSNRSGELIAETKLGELKHIILAVDFSYARPVDDGEIVGGEVILLKRDGDELRYDVECVRYLKGE